MTWGAVHMHSLDLHIHACVCGAHRPQEFSWPTAHCFKVVVRRLPPVGELNWVFTAITDTIAWNVLPRALFQKLFRQVRGCLKAYGRVRERCH